MSENLQTTNDPAAPNSDVTVYHFCGDPFVSKADYDRLRAEVERLTKERNNWKAHAISRGKRLRRARDKFINIRDGVEDEIDRVYFGSSNDAEAFKDEVAWLDDFSWDKIMGEPDDWDLLGALDKQKARAIAAEKSRDEAIAELNKALETLGQLRSDLRKAEEWKSEALHANRITVEVAEKWTDRAQSAEASLAKLREAVKDAYRASMAFDAAAMKQQKQGRANMHTGAAIAATIAKTLWPHIEKSGCTDEASCNRHSRCMYAGCSTGATLRNLLDEPDKDQKQ